MDSACSVGQPESRRGIRLCSKLGQRSGGVANGTALLALALLCGLAAAQPRKIADGGTTVNGQPFGSWRVFNSTVGSGDVYALQVRVAEVSEVNLNGRKIGTASDNRHLFTFGSDDNQFVFKELPSPVKTGTDDNVSAEGLEMDTLLGRAGKLVLQAYVFKEAGTIGPSGEEYADVVPGDVLLRLTASEWYFCGSCEDPVCLCDGEKGSYLDVLLEFDSFNTGGGLIDGSIDLGGGASMQPHSGARVDAAGVIPMPADTRGGYPRIIQQGSKPRVSLRFPKFQDFASHDTVLHLRWIDEDAPWIGRDYWLLFGPPSLVLLAVCCLLFRPCCKAPGGRPDYMERKLLDARRRHHKEAKKKREAERKRTRDLERQQSQESAPKQQLLPPSASTGSGTKLLAPKA